MFVYDFVLFNTQRVLKTSGMHDPVTLGEIEWRTVVKTFPSIVERTLRFLIK